MISGANRSTDDLGTDLGILSVIDDLAGMLRINLLTSLMVGGCKSVSCIPVYCMLACRGFISHSLFARLDFIVSLMLLIFFTKYSEKLSKDVDFQ